MTPPESIAPERRPSSRHHAASGHIVDERYRVGAEIARGSWSVVYDATHVRTGHSVALKMLLANLPGGDDRAEERFFREARMTAQLEHPNTVRVFDVGRTDSGALYFACERLTGRTLEDELEHLQESGERMTQLEAIDIAEQVLRSLKEAHGKGLVHRDLKPANLFMAEVGGERMIKVLDFGIARLLGHRITERGVALGSPDYMSPEQCACQDVDARSDLYAVAAILFHLVTGRPPFVGEDEWEVIDLHRSADVPDPRQVTRQPISRALAQLIMRGLSKHPGGRWQDAQVMLTALEDVHARLTAASNRRTSSAAIPGRRRRLRETTGQWSSASRETPAEMAPAEESGSAFPAVKTTARYTAVTDEIIEEHQARGPELEDPTRRDPVSGPTIMPLESAADAKPSSTAPQDKSAKVYRAAAIGLLLVALALAGLLAFIQQ